jgi:hypothetical protein
MVKPIVVAVAVVLFASAARAQDRGAATAAPAADPDWHPYVFSVDAPTLAPRRAALETGMSYNGVTGSGGGLQPDDARRYLWWMTGAIGVVDRVQIQGTLVASDDPTNGFHFNQGHVDAMVQLLQPRRRFPVAISVGAGYQLDAVYDSAVTGVVAVTADFGRLDLVANLRAAHYFAAGRDPIDLFVTAGALVRATRWLRVGAEYVGEDLEGIGGDDRDNSLGGRHYVGPTAVVQLMHGRLRLNATGGAVLADGRAGALARGGLAYLF